MTFEEAYRKVCSRIIIDQGKGLALWNAITLRKNESAHLAELGVFRGGSAGLMGLADPDRPIHLFDTFNGIPFKDEMDKKPVGDFRGVESSLENVKRFLAELDEERRWIYWPGVFPESAKGLSDTIRFSVVHIDADQYRSVREGIAFFFPRLVKNGVIVFDDFNNPDCPGVERAISEWLSICDKGILTIAEKMHQATLTRST